MKSFKLVKTLTDFGLTDNEAHVYLTCLSLGSSTVLQIAKKSQVKRTTIYSTIDTLTAKGLMSVEVKGFKKKYLAEDPNKLQEILDRKKQHLSELLPSLLSIQKLPEAESVLKYYEGLPAIKSLYKSLLSTLKENDDYYVIANNDYWYNLDPKYFQEFIEKRAEIAKSKNIKIKLLFQDSKMAKDHQGKEEAFVEKIKILPKNVSFDANIVITPRRLIIHQVKGQDIAIVIDNMSIVKTLQQVFITLWSLI